MHYGDEQFLLDHFADEFAEVAHRLDSSQETRDLDS